MMQPSDTKISVQNQIVTGVSRPTWSMWFLAAVLMAATIAIYGRTCSYRFVDQDDNAYVFVNPHVMGGLTAENIVWAWRTGYAGMWIPATWISLQLDATLSDPSIPLTSGYLPALPDATVYHAQNLMWQCVAGVMLFLFLRRATRREWASFLAALLWAMHPLRVESVAWVTERKDVLAGAFAFTSLYLYVAAKQTGNRRLMWGCTAAFGISLLAKAMCMTLPCVMVLVDFWPMGTVRTAKEAVKSIREKWLLFAIAAADLAITSYAIRGISDAEIDHATSISNGMLNYFRYLRLHFDFSAMATFYPYTMPNVGLAALSLVALLALTWAAYLVRRRAPWVLVGWLWYLGSFLPMIGFVQRGPQGYADRFTYFPAVGIAILIVYSIPQGWYERAALRGILVGTGVAVGGFLGYESFIRTARWRDTYAMVLPIPEATERLAVLSYNFPRWQLSQAYLRDGKLEESFAQLTRIIETQPFLARAQDAVGKYYLQTKQPMRSLEHFKAAVANEPLNAEYQYFYAIGLSQSQQHRLATATLESAAKLAPSDARIQNLLEQERLAASNEPDAPMPLVP